jgi:hypothetical protein
VIESGLRSLLLAAGLCLAGCSGAQSVAGEAPREMHGMADVFSAPGVALAWGVLRGADEKATLVVIRVVTHRASYPWFAVVGSDPFTKSKHQVLAAIRTADVNDLRASRAQFADFPRTELRFYKSEAAARQDRPALVVFYLGVPDTTPEFATEDKLQSYLRDRAARPPNPSE